MREDFAAVAAGGELGGWIDGEGVPVLLLHGGPGLSYEYLDELAADIGGGFRIAAFQQRGLAPSTLEGPFTMSQAIEDVIAVLDHLAWSRALIVGHSWGGHLGLRVAARHPDRLLGALAVEPVGVVGDGGTAAFEAEMTARTPRRDRDRMTELDQRAMDGQGTPEELRESLGLVWPAYFADPARTLPMPELQVSIEAYSNLIAAIGVDTDTVAAGLTQGRARYHVIAGAGSPIPWGQAARATAELSPHGSLTVLPGAGHFPWFEAPGCVRAALERLDTSFSPPRRRPPSAAGEHDR
jgi:pimeloyl-ACP methyl ester carboxylesterase